MEGIRFVGKTSEHGSTMLVGYGEITCLQTTDGRFKPLLLFLVCGQYVSLREPNVIFGASLFRVAKP
jgi:hypothetical protein